MATENILEAVDRIEIAVNRFERILYGDPPARPNGLIVEFEGLRKDVQGLRDDVHRLQNKRPNVLLWVAGFAAFVVSMSFGMVGFVNLAGNHEVWNLPGPVALWLAATFAVVALLLFLGGFGWLDGRA
jgi:hypothetical protein